MQDKLLEAVQVRAMFDTTQAAADHLGIPRKTLAGRLKAAEMEDIKPLPASLVEDPIDLDDLPDYDKTKGRLRNHNQDHIRRTEATRRLTVKVPHCVIPAFFVGDIHCDSPGFDDATFYADLDRIRAAQEEFGKSCVSVFMGDILDNWPLGGRLGQKQHSTHLTRKEALSLVRGILTEEGIDWNAVLLGNHDAWAGVDFETLLRQWSAAPVMDWAAYLDIVTSKGWEFRTFAAHDMKGHSMYNQVHGLSRRAREDGTAELYVAAHRHHTGQGTETNGHRGETYHYLRVGSYKLADEYAWHKGFPEEGSEGATALAVINPNATTRDSRCRTFYDLDEGMDFARMLRGRA